MKSKLLKNTLAILLSVVLTSGGVFLIIRGFLKILPDMPWWLMVGLGLIFIGLGIPIIRKFGLKRRI